MWSDTKLQARLLTALIAGPIVFAAAYIGDVPFLIMVVLVAILCLNEFLEMMRGKDKEAHRYDFFVHTISLALIVSAFMAETKGVWHLLPVKIFSVLMILYFLSQLIFEKVYFKGVALFDNIRAIVYIGFFLSFWVLVRSLPVHGLGYTVFIVLAVWCNDIFAYFIGLKFGKHRLNIKLSPKKSVEGAWGGFFGTILFAFLFGHCLGFTREQAVILGAVVSVLAQGGDLLESLFKRTSNIKDSSNLLPGHGGFLDRADSFILSVPVYYFILIHIL